MISSNLAILHPPLGMVMLVGSVMITGTDVIVTATLDSTE